ncbi:MAG: LPS export ABC transporter periplasmic protein LptC [Chitinophagia bacterium]|nr:LPS export ABC transporter periplasmic protein LptC [Chitinophagia bacterium]
MKGGLLPKNMNKVSLMKPFIYLFCLLSILCILSCHNDPAQIKLLTGDNAKYDKATNIMVIFSKKGKISARLYAKEYIKYSKITAPCTDLHKDIKIEFYNDSGTLDNVLTADSCRYYDKDGNAKVWGNVAIMSVKGEKLTTEALEWQQEKSRFYTDKEVTINTGKELLYGKGLEANQDFTWYKILNPTGIVQVNKKEIPN